VGSGKRRNQKATNDFIPGGTVADYSGNPVAGCVAQTPCLPPGGTTLNDFGFQVVKRIGKDFEVNGSFTVEHWKAPIYQPGEQSVTSTNIQLTWFPERRINF
jgi:hypothetical protein